jgi:hypothetical protein
MLTLDVPALNICQRTEKTYLAAGIEYARAGATIRGPTAGSAVVLIVWEIESC